MQLRGTPAERECKEKLLNRKIKIRYTIEVSLAAWLNLNTIFLSIDRAKIGTQDPTIHTSETKFKHNKI
jgi:hypothetical protein